jgi:3-hydroxyisobutyrate dehydrogenase-like beta-hydroxyacid dehydrogenase
MANIAFLGTGLLGSAFVEAAQQRGDQVTAWNRTIDKARRLEAFGARVASTPADAVRGAERVHLVLKDDAAVEDVVASLRPGLAPNTIIVDHTTALPELTAARATRLNADGVPYLHCPVFIGPSAARKSQGIIMVSGPQALFERVKPALEKQAAKVEYLGERPDLAAVYKLCGNAFIIGIMGITSDMFAVARGAGVEAQDALRLLEFWNPAAVILGRGRTMANQDFTPSFELTMARKDVELMLATAGGEELAMLPGLASRMDVMIARGYGNRDMAVIGKR